MISSTSGASSSYLNIPYDPYSPDFNAETLLEQPLDTSDELDNNVIDPRSTMEQTKRLQKKFTSQLENAGKELSTSKHAQRIGKIKKLKGDLNQLTEKIASLEKTQPRSNSAPSQGSQRGIRQIYSLKEPEKNSQISSVETNDDFRVLKWRNK